MEFSFFKKNFNFFSFWLYNHNAKFKFPYFQTELPKKGPCFKVIVKDRKPETLIKNGTAEEDDDDDVDLFGSDEVCILLSKL